MPTMRQDIDAKINALQAKIYEFQTQINALEVHKSEIMAEFGACIDKDPAEIKAFMAKLATHFDIR